MEVAGGGGSTPAATSSACMSYTTKRSKVAYSSHLPSLRARPRPLRAGVGPASPPSPPPVEQGDPRSLVPSSPPLLPGRGFMRADEHGARVDPVVSDAASHTDTSTTRAATSITCFSVEKASGADASCTGGRTRGRGSRAP